MATGTSARSLAYDSRPLLLGADIEYGELNYYSPIRVSDFRLYNVARTSTAIVADRDKRLVGNESGLVAYLPLDEGSGNVAVDATGQGNSGFLGGGGLPVNQHGSP